jgi:predicted TIM-barrel fold metal-dependent hydrolase
MPDGPEEYNRLNLNFREPMPRANVRGIIIDSHCHLFAVRHAPAWFEAADHYGIDAFLTMTPLEEAAGLQRRYPGRINFIVVPNWQKFGVAGKADLIDDWLRRLEAFYNMGSRVIKFHMAPQTIARTNMRLDSADLRPVIQEARARGMIIMTHVGDPDTWFNTKYTDPKFITRDQSFEMWEAALTEHGDRPWIGAHMGGNPENLPRLQSLLDKFPKLRLDMSATRWMAREISAHSSAAREFVIRNQDRLLWGSDQVSGDARGFDFLASRWWVHRKLWETDYTGPCPILDPDLPPDKQPTMHGLALPDDVLQKIYHDNAVKLLASVGVKFEDRSAAALAGAA